MLCMIYSSFFVFANNVFLLMCGNIITSSRLEAEEHDEKYNNMHCGDKICCPRPHVEERLDINDSIADVYNLIFIIT